MTEDSLLPFDLPAVRRKKVTAGFDGGLISSDGGLVLLREAERRLRLADTLAGIGEPRKGRYGWQPCRDLVVRGCGGWRVGAGMKAAGRYSPVSCRTGFGILPGRAMGHGRRRFCRPLSPSARRETRRRPAG